MRPATRRTTRSGAAQGVEPGQESLLAALEAVSADVGVPFGDLLKTVESALAAAYLRAFEPPGEIRVRLDPISGEMEVISRETAPDGSVGETRLPVDDFRRLAAQAARGAVLRRLRDLEREKALSEVSRHHGELASGFVDRIERGVAYVDMGRVEGWMPPEEQIPGEELRPGRPVTVVILEPNQNRRQAQVRVSRASRSFVLRLLEAEVPEISSGTVQVKALAREPGLRTKIAVSASEPGIDPVGACVGPRGVRHRSLLAELGHEHVDIVPYDVEPEGFVAAALGPATVVGVQVDADSRTATVRVPREQLSLAIGRDGQNARLAAKLTGWRVDIKAADDEADEP
jgi:N utilization substance protein A